MAILPIYTYDARVLREKTLTVGKPDDEILQLVFSMLETMKLAKGIGLAANQVGAEHSLFVLDLSDLEEYQDMKPLVLINPAITEEWGEDIDFEEGCLSIPDVREEISRPEFLHVRYRDLNFEEVELEADGMLARVIQHEFDHLQGIFFTDYLRGLKKRIVMPALRKIKKGEIDAGYELATLAEMEIIS